MSIIAGIEQAANELLSRNCGLRRRTFWLQTNCAPPFKSMCCSEARPVSTGHRGSPEDLRGISYTSAYV